MVRKKRTEQTGVGGESSNPQQSSGGSGSGSGGGGGRGQQGPPQTTGGQQGGGRGWGPQGGRGGYGGGRGAPQRGGMSPQQYGGPMEYQGRGPQQYQQRGGPPPQRRGASSTGGGRGGGPSGGSYRQSIPELHQASQAPYQPGGMPTQAMSSGKPAEAPGEASSATSPVPTEPSQVTQQLEQLSIQEGSSSQAIQPIPASSKAMRFPLRPGKGSTGIKCIVKANHFFAELPDKDLHQYDVSITPEVTSRGVNRAVMEQLVRLYRESHLGRRLPAYDGRKSLYTAGPLPFTLKEFKITLIDEDDGSGAPRRERDFKVVIKLAARVDLHHLGMFLQGRQADAPQEALQVLDIVLRELPTTRYTPVGRSFYSPDLGRRQPLGEDMSSTAFIEPLPVIDFVTQLLNRDVTSRPLSDSDRVKIKKALRGVKVEVTHRGNMRRKYRISGLTSQATRELTFPVDERGTMKSVVEYFRETYGFVIQHTQWPCLQVGNQQRPNYLPMEVCKIVEGQRYSKRLNERQITALLKVTCQRPQERERDILQTVRHNAYHADPYAQEFGIRIDEKLASVEARVLPAPWLKYHDTGREKNVLPQVGQWNMMNKVFNPNPVLPVLSARPDQVEKALKTRYHDAMSKLAAQNKELDLLIVILPDNNGSLYGDLKRICETELGIVSQCCLTKHVFKMSKQYLANVALKINVKVGGRNTVLVDAISRRIPLVSDRPTIIFGADVTHPHPGEDSSPSIAAVLLYELDAIRKACASLEPNYQPPVTFVVVQKRHHTRLFANDHRDRNSVDRSGNILPVPPAYYAHLAAFRARFYMEPETSDSGSMTSSAAAGRGGPAGGRSTRSPAANAAVRPLPALKENVKRVMFYC
ncbi:hypothetical protein Cgig2_028562 [Carnegiea gigantea]|uniref:Argonaute 1 n=1 Tax=Carnegiea gigantea TaxID=171969 RepID=A0A9Q1GSS3_9CARY|nr:hypothetical protein Cgig2_028562 [Carnegiea gigantea]